MVDLLELSPICKKGLMAIEFLVKCSPRVLLIFSSGKRRFRFESDDTKLCRQLC